MMSKERKKEGPMTKIEREALAFAEKCHGDQRDDAGLLVLDAHILHVVNILRGAGAPPELLAAAWLHDVIEDCGVTYETLVEKFGNNIADLVDEVTHEGASDQHGYYFPRLHSREGIMLKFADRLSNLTRMTLWSEERQDQYLRRSKFWRSE